MCVCVYVYIYVCIYIYINTYFMCTYIYVLNFQIFCAIWLKKCDFLTEKLGIKPDPDPKLFIPDPDPDPSKSSGSDRIRIHNTAWRSMTKIAGSGYIKQRHGSADPDPDTQQNVMDPQHWLKHEFLPYPAIPSSFPIHLSLGHRTTAW